MTSYPKFIVLLLSLILPLGAMGAAMKVGDLIAINSIIATNTITGSNVLDRYNVRWWGADPTGVSDSTLAIQNALNWAGSGKVHVPQGTYLITNLWLSNPYAGLSGDGIGISILKSTNTAPMIVLAGGQNSLESIALDGTTRAQFGLYLTNAGAEQGTFRNVKVSGAGTGIYSQTNNFSMSFMRCTVINCSTGMNLVASFQNTRIDHCLIYHNTNYQIILGTVGISHVAVSIQNTDLESITTSTNLLINDVAAVNMSGMYFESVAASGKDIVVDGITSLVGINGMYANGGAVSTNSIFVIGNSNALHLRDSYLWNYTLRPVIGGTRLLIVNTVTNGVYQ